MILTLKMKQDILDLLEHAGKIYAGKEDASLSDSKASKMCFNHGEFIMNLRKWDGGAGGPTMKNVGLFEQCMRDYIGEKEYERFLKTRTRPAVTSSTRPDDFD